MEPKTADCAAEKESLRLTMLSHISVWLKTVTQSEFILLATRLTSAWCRLEAKCGGVVKYSYFDCLRNSKMNSRTSAFYMNYARSIRSAKIDENVTENYA